MAARTPERAEPPAAAHRLRSPPASRRAKPDPRARAGAGGARGRRRAPQGGARRESGLLGRRDRRPRRRRRAGGRRAARPSRSRRCPTPTSRRRPLEPDQAAAAEALAEAVRARAFAPFLLEGVTGSGKTEVYFEAVAAALRAGRQTLVLMPEIALTAQFLDRFAARFGVRPAEWHSGVTPRRRERLWGAVASGEARVVVGARSALFLPFQRPRPRSSSTRSTRAPTSRRTASSTTRATWRWCGRGWRRRRSCSPRRRPRSKRRVNAEQGRYRWLRLQRALSRAAPLPDLAADRPAPRRPAARPLPRAQAGRGGRGDAGGGRAGAAVPQPPRLRAADAVPRLRPSLPVPELLGLAGRASLPQGAGVPPLRALEPRPDACPDLPRGRHA